MVRGVVAVLVIIFAIPVLLIAAEPVYDIGEDVKANDSVDSQMAGAIDNTINAITIGVPLVIMGGFMLWAVRWYLRRGRATRRF